ncbi:hypothetical protein BaRGS_00022590 [Batillaria attramentaria]|uniref:Cation efflux protein cytoplasmic domain-containing protein n=1 Tax=Batillaria attramentaria TaxID=370345 RepID=A0ABD0KG26_9CAEN
MTSSTDVAATESSGLGCGDHLLQESPGRDGGQVHVYIEPSEEGISLSSGSAAGIPPQHDGVLSVDSAAGQMTVHSKSSSHSVCMIEFAPSDSKFRSTDKVSWKLPLWVFSSRKANLEERDVKGLSRRVKKYYKEQDELIEDNFILLVVKAVAVALSGSISIISSMIDSSLDLLSGIVIWYTSRAIRRSNPYKYPSGKRRMEPLAIVVLSVILSIASVQLIIESVQKIIGYTSDKSSVSHFEVPTIVITCFTVGLKFGLFLLCYLLGRKHELLSGSVGLLVQDHRNDTLSNTVALICGYLGSKEFALKTGEENVVYIDPAGAIVIGAYIFVSWWQKGLEQIRMLTGITAKPDFLSKVTWMCLNHSPHITKIDTVRAFHFGNRFLVEVDIVLPRDMTLDTTHGIGESLQQKLERLKEVERAFVHCDWQIQDPEVEHKVD